MKTDMAYHDMTFTALARRADSTIIMDAPDDTREVTVFLEHDQSCQGEDYGYKLEGKEIIGVALCDLDDPLAVPEILTRDEAWDRFGRQWIEDIEVTA